jgi:large subunit ribosomal protein L24
MSCYFTLILSKFSSCKAVAKVVVTLFLFPKKKRMPTKIERRKVEKTLEDGRLVSKWSRYVKGTDIEIPKPVRKYNDQSGEELFTTSPEDASAVTYQPDLTQPPIPADLLRELRNPYKKRYA